MDQSPHWKAPIPLSHPVWDPYRELISRLPDTGFPDCDALQQLLPSSISTAGEKPVRFTPADQLPDGPGYEAEIAASGRISTRPGTWHDLFNALVWARFPMIKAAMNRQHTLTNSAVTAGQRGTLRDTLTLFDECGLLVLSDSAEFLQALAAHQWPGVFGTAGEAWPGDAVCWVPGHANLEKMLNPYKAMTGNALLIHTPSAPRYLNPTAPAKRCPVDQHIAEGIVSGRFLTTPRSLCPLPFMGIPGWWRQGNQDEAFYADRQVFRPAAPGRPPRPVYKY